MSTNPTIRPDEVSTDINFSAIWKTVIVFIVVSAGLSFGVWRMFRYLRGEDARRDVRRTLIVTPSPIPPEPRLQVHSHEDLQEYLRAQRERLNSYAWVSRDQGVVRIPIERAMDLVIEREKR